MTVPETDRLATQLLAGLRTQYPDSAFLALGQTVFWDEPVKAVLRRMLDDSGLGGRIVVGVHDTDYFAKARVKRAGPGRFALMPHNDGTTKDLWSAAGEISTLFGSETFPSRSALIRNGVALERLARASAAGRQAFIDEVTEAWGWRGLVYTGSRDLIVSRLPLREVGESILKMLAWGFDNAVCQVTPFCCNHEARRVADTILGWCRDYLDVNPDRTLTDLFQHCLPRMYEMLLQGAHGDIAVTGTSKLLQFCPDTVHLPRFRFVNLFLDPATRDIARRAYDQAVAGSEIYTLDKFGAGGLPFDLIVPDRGRGTLRLTDRALFVETRQPIAIGLKRPIRSVQDLAETLSAKLGPEITLVGKAVTLVSMLAQEFIFTFHEEGSMYVHRTRRMNDAIAAHGISLDMRPILRLRHHTWDALVVGESTLQLPEHLATAFGRRSITVPELASTWKQIVKEQSALCEAIKEIRKPLDLIEFLNDRDPVGGWDEKRQRYLTAKQVVTEVCTEATAEKRRVQALYERLRELRAQSQSVQQARGEHFRSVREWSAREREVRESFAVELQRVEHEKRALLSEARGAKERRFSIERGVRAAEARAQLAAIELEAELARLHIVRSALLTVEGLPHTNHRPSAWWLPMLDRKGAIFRRMSETTELYTEPLLTA